MAQLQAEEVTLSYGGAEPAVRNVTLRITPGAITTLIGPNGCGKSTLLRALARLMSPQRGEVLLDGELIHRRSTKAVARQLSLLSQQAQAPEAITVEDLVRRGRYPHQNFLQPPTRRDEDAVERALSLAGMTDLRKRAVDELSGGQRQRAWIAMALAQETQLLLLDEPTTYLDIAHQQEVLALLRRLNREEGRTLVLVLHDLNDALQISDRVVVMQSGQVRAEGAPDLLLSQELLKEVFGLSSDRVVHPELHTPVIVPRGRVALAAQPAPAAERSALRADRLSTGYGGQCVVKEVSVSIPERQITAIVGPNASGKSTLLRTFARLLPAMSGEALLLNFPVTEGSHRAFAQKLAVQMQGAEAPAGIMAEDLAAVGRHPYQRWFRQWSRADQQAVDEALDQANVNDLRQRAVDTLSGGQRQRVWLAMALAQQTPILMLDEPTSFLDTAHQVEFLDWVWKLNRSQKRTVVMVLHDLGMACRYADYLIVMKAGQVAAAGAPEKIVSEKLVQDVFGVRTRLSPDPLTGKPLVLLMREADSSLERPAPDAYPSAPLNHTAEKHFI